MPKDFKPDMGAGDLGLTDLFGGRRVPKTHSRIKLNALLDDLSALLGLLKTGLKHPGLRSELSAAQAGLIKASGIMAGAINALSATVKPPKKFVLPGSCEIEALAHLARARTRICEILAWELKAKAPAVYLNRLSDYLFLVALKHAGKK